MICRCINCCNVSAKNTIEVDPTIGIAEKKEKHICRVKRVEVHPTVYHQCSRFLENSPKKTLNVYFVKYYATASVEVEAESLKEAMRKGVHYIDDDVEWEPVMAEVIP